MYFRDDLESECGIRDIDNQKTKHHLAVSKLPVEVLREIRELISVPKEKPFIKLRGQAR